MSRHHRCSPPDAHTRSQHGHFSRHSRCVLDQRRSSESTHNCSPSLIKVSRRQIARTEWRRKEAVPCQKTQIASAWHSVCKRTLISARGKQIFSVARGEALTRPRRKLIKRVDSAGMTITPLNIHCKSRQTSSGHPVGDLGRVVALWESTGVNGEKLESQTLIQGTCSGENTLVCAPCDVSVLRFIMLQCHVSRFTECLLLRLEMCG
jgi:hypothetical protein